MRTFLLTVCLVAVSLIAGVAIAGCPSSVTDDLVIASRPSPATSLAPDPVTTAAAPATTAAATTSPPLTVPTTDTDPPETAVATTLVPIENTRVVVANAIGSPGLARSHADELIALGYTAPTATDSAVPVERTTVYFAAGFRAEAMRLAEQLGPPAVAVEPRLPEPMAFGDPDGDLWVILADDRAP